MSAALPACETCSGCSQATPTWAGAFRAFSWRPAHRRAGWCHLRVSPVGLPRLSELSGDRKRSHVHPSLEA